MVESNHMRLLAAVGTITVIACAVLYLKQQPEIKQKHVKQPEKKKKKSKNKSSGSRVYDPPLPAQNGEKKKEDKTPKAIDPSKCEYKLGDAVEVNAGGRGWVRGEITGPAVATKNGNILYMVRRPSSRPDPNNTGVVRNPEQESLLPSSKLRKVS